MRNLFALLLVAGALAFSACEEKKTEEANVETVDSTSIMEEPTVDTATAPSTEAAPAAEETH